MPHIVCATSLRSQGLLYGRRRAIILAFLNIQTRLRDHDVEVDEAVVWRGLVETPFDIETSGFTCIYTLDTGGSVKPSENAAMKMAKTHINVDSLVPYMMSPDEVMRAF